MDKTGLHQALEKLSENSRTLTVFKIIQKANNNIYILFHRSSGFTSNHCFIATELFRMVQGPHSSGNFDD